ncbi:MAG: flotillin domain-containing protein [Edafosvirus sp.]|uniref:Flotillin domain-containing protein n=1 Tax=Edafosvirus sp. TaxID=2487765 RepID=A0A3G4ZV42_9VIRU|nr:MAG: flotillin domain-containing protein [Edafosvirus sp.]
MLRATKLLKHVSKAVARSSLTGIKGAQLSVATRALHYRRQYESKRVIQRSAPVACLVDGKRQYGSSALDTIANVAATGAGIGAIAAIGTGAWLTTRYKVASAGEYLVRTGPFIDDVDISRRAFQLPYQTMTRISLEPNTYHCVIEEAMDLKRVSFNLPTVFTVGPKDDIASLKIYAKLLQQSNSDDLKSKIIGIIQGETRMAAGRLPLDDLFNNREKFKEEITERINDKLSVFGLHVYNANIEELRDMKGTNYFADQRKRALEIVSQKASVDVAEQQKLGHVGKAQHATEQRQKLAEYEKQAKLIENERDREIAESAAALSVAKADFERKMQVAQFESKAASEKRQLELQKEVEEFRNKQNLESLRASEFTVANVKAEVDVRKAEGIATSSIREAEGKANALKIAAEGKATALKVEAEAQAMATKMTAEAKATATKLQADADAEATKLKAAANLVHAENEAKGIVKLRGAEAEGLTRLIESAGGVQNLSQYLMVRDGVVTQIAEQQAKAVHDMKPTVNVWQTGSKETGTGGLSDTVNDLLRNGMPLLDGIKSQTGIDFMKAFRSGETSTATKA